VKVFTVVCDPKACLLPLFEKVKTKIGKEFEPAFCVYTKDTNLKLISVLEDFGFKTRVGGLFGESRILALKETARNFTPPFFYCDLDKIIHWYLVKSEEFRNLLDKGFDGDFFIAGRPSGVFLTYPLSLQKTESIANELSSQILGEEYDVMIGDCGLGEKSVEVILKKAFEKSWGSVSEWPLLCFKHGLRITTKQFLGLTWENPERFQDEIKAAGGQIYWERKNYNSLFEWEKRTTALMEQIKVIQRLFGERFTLS